MAPKQRTNNPTPFEVIRVHLLAITPIAIGVVVALPLILLLLALYARLIGTVAFAQLSALAATPEGATWTTIGLMVPVVLLVALAGLMWAGLVVQVAASRVAKRRMLLGTAAVTALTRAPRAALATILILLGVVAAIVTTPLLVLAGIVGLIIDPLARPSINVPRWPKRSTLITMAIPFGFAVHLISSWALVLPTVWLQRGSLRSAFAESVERSRGRELGIGVTFVLTAAVTVLASEGAVALAASLQTGVIGDGVARLITILIVGPMTLVGLTVWWYRDADVRGAPEMPAVDVGGVRKAKVAVAVTMALLVPLSVAGTPPPAYAAGGSDVAFRIETVPEVVPPNTPVTVRIVLYNPSSSVIAQPTGTVTITIDDVEQPAPYVPDGAGTAIEFQHTFGYGAHKIEGLYSGDETFVNAPTELEFSVGEATTLQIQATGTEAVYGDPLTVTATVSSSAATGLMEFTAIQAGNYIGVGSAPIMDGSASFDASRLAPGVYDIYASYYGDDIHLPSAPSITVPVTITPSDTTLTIDDITPPSPVTAGTPLTATVTVDANTTPATPTGKVQVFPSFFGDPLGEGTLVNGVAQVQFQLPPGNLQQVWFVYESDTAGFITSRLDTSYTVEPYEAGVTLTQSASTTSVGEAFTLRAVVVDGPTPPTSGTVIFRTDSTELGQISLNGIEPGVAELSVSDLPSGIYSIVADYQPAGVTTASSNALPHTVTKAAANLEVSGPTTPQSAGALVPIVVSVSGASGTPSGQVELWRNGSQITTQALIAGTTTFLVSVGPGGDATFSAEYLGDDNYLPNSGSTVVPVSDQQTVVTVQGATARSAHYGDSVTFAGTVLTTGNDPAPGTVELYVDGVKVGEGTLTDGAFDFTSSTIAVDPDHPTRLVWVKYLGEGEFAPSTSEAEPISFELEPAASDPVLSMTPGPYTVGGSVGLFASLSDVGDGPTGTVTFRTLGGSVLATAEVENGIATTSYTITAANQIIEAYYEGDDNFEPGTSASQELNADMVAAVVTLADPGNIVYGTTRNLVATVSIANGAILPSAPVQFRADGGGLIGTAPLIAGTATLTVCAGDVAACGDWPVLGSASIDLYAYYPLTEQNLAGQSALKPYTLDPTSTTTTVTATPSVLVPGTAVFLNATVDAPNLPPAVHPQGSVSFYAVIPNDVGPDSEKFLGNDDTLVNGVADLETQQGDGEFQIDISATGIIARYFPAGHPYSASNDSTPLNQLKEDLEVTVNVPAIVQGQTLVITVGLVPPPGAVAIPAGLITVFLDGNSICSGLPAAFQCSFAESQLTVGSHTFSASFAGDDAYNPGTSDDVTVVVNKRLPALGGSVPLPVVSGEDVTVTWNVFDPAAEGTVRVTADGVVWCDVDVTVGSCTSHFTNASATGALVDVFVRYFGDDNWSQTQTDLKTRVNACATLDIHSANTAGGTVRIDTPPNCGGTPSDRTGFVAGTTVTMTATPIPPSEFVRWEKLEGGFTQEATTPTASFLVTNDSTSWVHRAQFRVPCYPVTADADGSGRIALLPASNCTTPAGDPGWSIGTAVEIFPIGTYNPGWEENDAFVSFGPLPAGAATGTDQFGNYRMTLTVNAPVTVHVRFGPQCRTVPVLVAPSTGGDQTNIISPFNCTSFARSGFTRFSTVTVSATSGDPNRVLASWSVNGVVVPWLGRQPTATVRIELEAPIVTANFVTCYPLNIQLSSLQSNGRDAGRINVAEPANCPDGSKRYLPGTELTLTPEILIQDASFNGWDPTQLLYYRTATGKGVVTAAVKKVVITPDLVVHAGFYLESSCSRINLLGAEYKLLTFPNTGCGPGRYFDLWKEQTAREGITGRAELHAFRYRSTLTVTLPDDVKMDVYVSIQGGDAKNCFGVADPGEPSLGWQTYGPLTQVSDTCDIGGDIDVVAETCQTLQPTIKLRRDGGVYDETSIPSTLLMKGPDGLIGPVSMGDGFRWVEAATVQDVGGAFVYDPLRESPCQRVGNAFPAGHDIAIYALTPVTGIVWAGWEGVYDDGSLLDSMPMIRTTSEDRKLPIASAYDLTCFHLGLGEGVVVESGATCPGTSPDELMFIAGTAVQVKAAYQIGNRQLVGFLKDVVNGQTWQDETTKELHGFAYMDDNKQVWGDYLTSAQFTGRGVLQGLKIASGIFAVAAPIVLGMLFPPAGMLLAGLAAAAGISSLIPGGDKVAAIFDLLNPANITQCAAKWAFNSPTPPTSGPNVGGIVSTVNNIRKIVTNPDAFIAPVADLRSLPFIGAKLPKSLANLPGGLSFALGGAAFGYGLYDAGIGHTDFGPQTIENLNDTGTMTSCLNHQWRATGETLGQDPSSPAG